MKSKISEFVSKRREQLRISQAELALQCGLPSGTIASVETGKAGPPKLQTLRKLAEGLGVDYEEIAAAALGTEYTPPISGWQFMDSAPRDGREILVYWSDNPEEGYQIVVNWEESENRWETFGLDQCIKERDLKAWHPCPESPKFKTVLL